MFNYLCLYSLTFHLLGDSGQGVKCENPTGFNETHQIEVDKMSLVNRTISKDSEKAFKTWQNYDEEQSDFCDIDDEEDPKMVFIDLLKNPERFTGYDGEAAHKG